MNTVDNSRLHSVLTHFSLSGTVSAIAPSAQDSSMTLIV